MLTVERKTAWVPKFIGPYGSELPCIEIGLTDDVLSLRPIVETCRMGIK